MTKIRLKKVLSVFLSVLMVLSCWVWVAPESHNHAHAAEVNNTLKNHYLFAYFTGNSSDGQTIHLAVSKDGLHYTALRNNEPVIVPSKGTGAVRDPYIWYNEQDNYYYLIGTDMDAADNQWWDNCNGFLMWRSKDLVHWYDETFINVYDMLQKFTGKVGIVHRAWAPQIMWDGQSYIVYFSIDTDNVSYPADQLSIVYLKTTDLMDLDAYYEYGGILYPGFDVNDADIIQHPSNGKWYLFYKPEGEGSKIKMMVADNATGPYSSPVSDSTGLDIFASVTEALEGGNGYFDNEGNFVMYADAYGRATPYFYIAKTSANGDFNSWTVYGEDAHNINSLAPRHGSVVRITEEEYDRLLKNAYGVTASSFPITEELSAHLVGRYFTTSDVTYNAANGKNDLTVVNGIGMHNDYLPEKIGYYASFTGNNYAKINLSSLVPEGFSYSDGFTITFTALINGNADSKFYSISNGSDSTSFAVNGSVTNNTKTHTTSMNLGDGALHDYIISYADGNIIVYKDGELLIKKNRFNDGVMTRAWYDAISDGTLYIGALADNSGCVVGGLSDFCIYDCSMSYYDVKNIQNEQDIAAGLVNTPVDNSSFGTAIPSWTDSTTSQMSGLTGTYFSNLLYSPQVTGMPSGASKDSNPTTGNGAAVAGNNGELYYGVYYANNTVLYVDGKTTPKMPVYAAGRINSNDVPSGYLSQIYPTGEEFSLVGTWPGWNSSSVYHDTIKNPDGVAIGYNSSTSGAYNLATGNSQDARKIYYFSNVLQLNEQNISFDAQGYKKYNLSWHVAGNRAEDNGSNDDINHPIAHTMASGFNTYIINLKPYFALRETITAEYASLIKNPANCPATIENYKSVVETIFGFNPNSYNYAGGTEAAVQQCAADMNKLIAEYNTAKANLGGCSYVTVPGRAPQGCMLTGLTDGKYCEFCGVGDEYTEQEIIPAASHKFGAPETSNGVDYYVTCQNIYDGVKCDYKVLVKLNEVRYENLFSLQDWKKSGSFGTPSANNPDQATFYSGTITVNETTNNTISILFNADAASSETYTAISESGVRNNSMYAVTVEGGKEYVLEYTAASTGTMTEVFMFFFDGDGKIIGQIDGTYHISVPANSAAGTTVNYPVTAPAGAKYVEFRFDSNSKGQTAIYKNIGFYTKESYDTFAKYNEESRLGFNTGENTELLKPVRDGYSFGGWLDANGRAVTNTNQLAFSQTLYATWLDAKLINWVNDDGTVLKKEYVANGATPSYTGEPPTKAATAEWTYTFKGWSPAIEAVTKDATYTATYTATKNKYTVTWVVDGKTTTEEYEYGQMPVFKGSTDKAADEGATYTFTGWDKALSAVTGAITYTAQYEKVINKYTVTFVGFGGAVLSSQEVEHNSAATAPEAPAVEGYTFMGWDKTFDSIKESVTVKAIYTINQFTITFDTDGGTAIDAITQDYGTEVIAPKNPEKTGYTFNGWDVEIPATMPAANIVIKAKWTINQYTITFDTLGGSAVAPIVQDYNTAVTAPAAPSKAGYTFKGWENLPATMPAENITVKAIWEVNGYAIEYNANGGEGSVDAQSFTYADAVTLRENAFTKTGYHFIGWALSADGEVKYQGGQSGVTALTTEAGVTVTLYAVWEKNTYTVTFDKNDAAATGEMAVQSFTYDEAEKLDALGFSKEGYTFTGWNTSADGKGTAYSDKESVENLTAVNGGNITLYAQWTINLYDVTFKFYLATGAEQVITLEDIPHGTAFSALEIPNTFVNIYYNGSLTAPEENTVHYNFTGWANQVDKITSDIEFVAEYTAVGHNLTPTSEDKAATCTATGVQAERCAVCGYSFKKVLPMLEHQWYETGRTGSCTEDGKINYACFNCTNTKQETLTAPGHKFSAVTPADAPSCTEEGRRAYKTCTVCNLYFEENAGTKDAGATDLSGFIIGAGGHTEKTLEAVEPTCTTTGLTEGKQCTVCGTITVPQTVIPENGHSLGDYIVDVEPDCTEKGSQHKECANCDYETEAEEIEELGHDRVQVSAQASTCEGIGWEAYEYCKREGCDYTTYEELSANGHNYGTLIPETPATCVSEGTIAHFTCSVCQTNFDKDKNKVDTLVIEKNDNHVLHTVEAKSPTCDDFGWDTYDYCTREGCVYSEYVEIPALGHKYVGSQTLAPTCTDKGEMTYTCSNDSTHTYKEATDALGHTFKDAVAYVAPKCEETGHHAYKECETCGKFFAENEGTASLNGKDSADFFTIEATDHNYKPLVTLPGCETEGYTTYICQNDETHTYVDDYVGALGHTEGAPVIEKDVPASCLVNGSYEEVIYCSVCSEELSRVGKVHTAPGHTEAVRQENIQNATCTTPGSYDNITYCSVCNETIGEPEHVTGVTLPHNYSEQIIDTAHLKTPATCYSLAVYYYDCAVCDANAKDAADGDNYTFTYGTTIAHTEGTPVIEDKNDSTCYEEGSYNEVVYCSVCEAAGYTTLLSTTSKTIEKKDHTEGAPKTESFVDSTCYAEGSYNEVVYCSVCEAAGHTTLLSTTPKTVAKKDHTPAAAVQEDYVAPSCHTQGSYNDVVYCSVAECHEKLSTTPKTVATIAHTAGTPVREHIEDSTCYQTGTYDEVIYCSVCAAVGKTKEMSRVEKIIAKKNHTAGTPVQENINDSTCYQTGTYDEVVYCSACKAVGIDEELSRIQQTIGLKEHTPGEAETEAFVDSTCYREGSYNTVVYCSVCKAAGHTTLLSTTEKTVEKKAHTPGETVIEDNVPPTCYSEGHYDEVVYCSVCAEQNIVEELNRDTITVDKTAHTPAEAVTENIVAPKCEEDGHHDEVIYCSVCAAAGKTYVISRVTVTDPMTGHVSGTYTGKINEDAGDCMTEASWTLITYCNACNEELEREDQTGEKNPDIHTGNNNVQKENVVPGTCISEETWNDVTYCECGEKLSSVPQTGEKNADNHTGTPTKTVGYTAPTCKDEGYTGDTHYTCCDALYATGTAIPTVDHTEGEAVVENDVPASCIVNGSYDEVVYCTVCNEEITRVTKTHTAPGHTNGTPVKENVVKMTCTSDGSYDEVIYCTVCSEEVSRVSRVEKTNGHTPAPAVRENEIPATEEVDGSYDSVVYCSVCSEEISREKVLTKVERTITFVMKDKTVEIKAYNGDTITPPEVEGYKGADGFNYKFVKWDKTVTAVYGDTTYTAIYNKPADWSVLDNLEETLNEVLESGDVDEALLEANKKEIESVLKMIEDVNKDRDILDTTGQSRLEYIAGKVSDLIDVIYPDVGSTLVIEGSSIFYTGGVISLKAVKMPLGQIINDVTWVSSDEDIVFCANGKLYAVGTGTVTLTATRGIHKASKTIEVINGGETRGITFTALSSANYIIEDYKYVKNSTIIYWSNEQSLRFSISVYTSYVFDDFIVYINGAVAEPDENGYYYVEAKTGDVIITVAGAITEEGDDGQGGTIVTKWSFWEWLLQLFRKIGDFFRGLFA